MVKCKDKVLLCKRNNLGSFPGMWSIPGGKMEDNGETPQEGAKREFLEETDVNIDDKELQFIGLIPRHTRDVKKVKGLMYVYLLEVEEPIIPDLVNAIEELHKGLTISPNNLNCRFTHGVIMFKLGLFS